MENEEDSEKKCEICVSIVTWQNAFQHVHTDVKSPIYLQHSARQFVRMYQRGSYRKDFHETDTEDFYENLSRKSKEESNTLHEEVSTSHFCLDNKSP